MKTLSDESKIREQFPISSGCLEYFPAAIAGVARHSFIGGAKYNNGGLVHLRYISTKHRDCIQRHLMDLNDLEAAYKRGVMMVEALIYNFQEKREVKMMIPITQAILIEANALAWRSLATSQELHEKYGGHPVAPAAVLTPPVEEPATILIKTYVKDAQISLIKALRTILNLSLKEAVDMTKTLPQRITLPATWKPVEARTLLIEAGAVIE